MDRTYWHRQTAEKPLFPDILWSRPEHAAQAGKLGIVGGNVHGFAAPAEAYQAASKAGVGTVRVLLPNSLQKTVGRVFEAGEYAPSTPSGSFSQLALSDVLELGEWANAVLLAGGFGHNSETAILLEKVLEKHKGQLSLAGDTVDYFLAKPQTLLARADTLLMLDPSQLQKLAVGAHFSQAFTSTIDFLPLVERLHDFSQQFAAIFVVQQLDTIFIAADGWVSTTKIAAAVSLLSLATTATVWWLQNPTKAFEAVTTAMIA